MGTLHDIALVWGQFDDASDDETFGAEGDEVSQKAAPVHEKRGTTFGIPVKHANDCGPRTRDTNQPLARTTNQARPQQEVIARNKASVRFAQQQEEDVSEKGPVHVTLTYGPTKQFPTRELRGSSRRASEETRVSRAKAPRLPTKLKAQPHRTLQSTPKTMASVRTAVAAEAASQATTMVSTKIASDHHGLKWLQRLPQLGERSSTMTESSSIGEGTTKVPVATATRAREVETAEVLRSLRQTNKMSVKIPVSKSTDKVSVDKQNDNDIEFVGVFPRPIESSSRTSVLSPAKRVLLQSGYDDTFKRISMPACTRNEKRKGEDIPAIVQEVNKRQRSRDQSLGAARSISLPLHNGSPLATAPKSVTPPLSFVPGPLEGNVQGEPEMLLESQKRHRQLQQQMAQAAAHLRLQRQSGLKPALKSALKRPAVPTARNTVMHLPQFQAPRLLMPTKGPTLMAHRQVLCVLPPHLLPPPVLTTMRSKTAVEGFVAPRNVPAVSEDKERKLPIANAGLRKRDVLFFAPLVKCKIQHYGTLQYCFLCFKYQELFLKSNSTEKREILNNLVRYVRAHGGRFLEWDEKEKCWFEIGDVRAAHRTMLGFTKDAPLHNNDETEKI